MFKLKHPSMCLNAEDLPKDWYYKGWNTREVAPDVSPFWLATNISSVADGTQGAKLALAIQCHGWVDNANAFLGLKLGQGIYFKDLTHFSILSGKIEIIHITACGAARGATGKQFCGKLAQMANTYVVAAEQDQKPAQISARLKFQEGDIDDYEGPVYKFGPKAGDVTPWVR